jgi:FkbM family methyltransferase
MRPKASTFLKNARRAPEIVRCAAETPQWPQLSGAYLGFSELLYPSVLRLRRGERIYLRELADVKTFWQIFLRRIYRVETNDRVILDLGANVGLFALYAARQAPGANIFAVEPFPATFERLVEAVSHHGLTGRIACLNCAVTDAGGARYMGDDPLPSQRRSLLPPGRSGSGIHVQAKTLEELLREQGLNKVDLVKMDIEGCEYGVLLSSPIEVLRSIRRFALEYHGDCAPYSKGQIFDRLRKAGFKVIWDVQDDLGYGVAEAVLSEAGSPARIHAELGV